MEHPNGDIPRLHHHLRDGTPIVLRPVQPEDRERMKVGFGHLSHKTRFQRFFRAIRQLSEEDLDYLTRIDQVDHVAWCAVDPEDPSERGIGLARFIRDPEDPATAEVAFVVIDASHRRGVGRALLAALMVRAEEVGVRRFRAVVRPDNDPMIVWMRSLGAEESGEDGDVHEFTLPVGLPISKSPAARDLDRLRRTLRVQLRRSRRRVKLAGIGRFLGTERGAS